MPLQDNFRANLQAAIDRLDLSNVDLAELSGVHVVTISRILHGHLEPSLSMCEKLAAAVKIAPEKILQKNVALTR